ncbi:unnamed protein product [Trifolium pratense]|uniref:Uncharacterized protein n=1 Tax=Trifolium pratense TaxID=57577 RepID=A0ACB0M1V8_TRIPR|nr:unnamed protein product [Trifolium pratense]
MTRCNRNKRKIENGTCSGIGCCQVDIPTDMRNISIEASNFPNSTGNLGCSVSFIVKHGFYNFSTIDLHDFRYDKVPLILDWSVRSTKCNATQVPLLVYEFVSNGTLFDFMHNIDNANNVTWKTCLRIASETAGALSYLHSAASIPIIHRDVKSTNILLDENYTAKVSDFGASRLVPLDHTKIATVFWRSSCRAINRRETYFPVYRPEEKRNLSIHFLSCLRENRMFEVLRVGILNADNKDEIKEVAILAAKCLRLKGEERPSMKEVAMELEGMRLGEKHPWTRSEINLEETESLLQETSLIKH